MTILDGPMGRLARTLVAQFGRPALIEQNGESRYDTATGTVTMDVLDTIECHVVLSEFQNREIDGTIIQQGDRKGIVSRVALGYQPTANRDTLTEGGRTWKILRLIGYSSGAEEAAYECHLRRA